MPSWGKLHLTTYEDSFQSNDCLSVKSLFLGAQFGIDAILSTDENTFKWK